MLHVFPAQGFEPQSPASKADVLPLDDAGMRCGGKESNLLPEIERPSALSVGQGSIEAGEGNRTLIVGLEDRGSSVELRPQLDGVRIELTLSRRTPRLQRGGPPLVTSHPKWALRGSNPLPPVKSRQLYP